MLPKREKYLILYGNDALIFDAKTDKLLIKGSIKTNEREITDFVKWLNDDELVVVVNHHTTNIFGRFKTSDFKDFQLIEKIEKTIKRRYSNSYNKQLVQKNNDKKIVIQYENGETWDTGLAFEFTGFCWSNDDRYLQVSNDNEEYLIDTVTKTTRKTYLMSSNWAPTKNLLMFMGHSVYDPETQEVTYINRSGIPQNSIDTRIWSPNSEKILIATGKELFVSNINIPEVPPKKLLKVDEPSYLEEKFFWSKDGRSLFGIYQRTARNIVKPLDFIAFKINLVTGKVQEVYLNDAYY